MSIIKYNTRLSYIQDFVHLSLDLVHLPHQLFEAIICALKACCLRATFHRPHNTQLILRTFGKRHLNCVSNASLFLHYHQY